MRRTLFLIVGTGLLLVSSAWAEEWSKTYNITGKPDLRVRTTDANIRVDTWDKNLVEAHVSTGRYRIGEGGVTILESQSGDTVDVQVKLPRNHFGVGFHRDEQVEVTVHVPREGHVNLHTADGAIRLTDFKGGIELESGDGSIDAEGVDGTLRARAGDGHIRVDGRFDGVQISTGDGRIDTHAEKGSSLGSGWEIQAGDGSVSVELPWNLGADLELQTGDGHISLDAPVTVEGRLESNRVHGKLNGGGGTLRVHTGDGSIQLKSVGI